MSIKTVKGRGLSAIPLAFMLILFVLPHIISAADTALETATEASTLELVRDWRVLSALAIVFSIILIALAYMIGQAFEMPQMRAWAQNEMVQVFMTVIIILGFTATALLLDTLMEQIVVGSNLGFTCSGSSNCAVNVSEQYLGGLIDTALGQAKENIEESQKAAQLAYSRFGLSTPVLIPMLQMSTSFTFTAGKLMDVDRRMIVVEYLGNILASLYSQEFFVKEISFKLAPFILAIGIVARSFFMTRRLGGLLIAVAIGVMYVFPLMYVFDWLTLNVTMFGSSSLEVPQAACPAACLITPPRFYSDTGQQFYTDNELYEYLKSKGLTGGTSDTLIQELIDGTASSNTFNMEEIYSCQATECPQSCRDLPYSTAPECVTEEALEACAELDTRCKLIRYVNPDGTSDDDYNDLDLSNGECPAKCRTVPPLKADCRVGDCLEGSDFCRFVRRVNTEDGVEMEWPTNCDDDPALDCPADLNASKSCVWILPDDADIEAHDCDSCNFVPQEYTYDPPIYLSCTDLCNPSPTGPPKISPADFTRRSAEGMVGKEEIKAVAALMLPAYVLPIINILVTLIFIRSFSQLIGGDMMIPGLMRVL